MDPTVDGVDLDALREWMDGEGLGDGPITGVEPLTGGTQNILLLIPATTATTSSAARRSTSAPTATRRCAARHACSVLSRAAMSRTPG
jgi:hypothetical protein